jgi:hypothetical protein
LTVNHGKVTMKAETIDDSLLNRKVVVT